MSYIHNFIFIFPGYITNQFNDQLPVGLLAQLVRALHRYRRGQGSSPGKPDFFRLSFRNCISCVSNYNCEDLPYIYIYVCSTSCKEATYVNYLKIFVSQSNFVVAQKLKLIVHSRSILCYSIKSTWKLRGLYNNFGLDVVLFRVATAVPMQTMQE